MKRLSLYANVNEHLLTPKLQIHHLFLWHKQPFVTIEELIKHAIRHLPTGPSSDDTVKGGVMAGFLLRMSAIRSKYAHDFLLLPVLLCRSTMVL